MTTSITKDNRKLKLETKNVSVQFEDKKIIEDISVRLHENELVCVLGLSGVGKTTLFNVIAGLISPSEGTVEMNGTDITGKSGNISYMLQKDLLLPFNRQCFPSPCNKRRKKERCKEKGRKILYPVWTGRNRKKISESAFRRNEAEGCTFENILIFKRNSIAG